MFFSNSLLSNRSSNSPLSKIWLASHLSSKLSKAAFLALSIPTSIPSILEPPQSESPSLRLSGQLLLGVVRVYSRKAKYLYDDCGDALQRIKGAFLGMTTKGSGKVDMEEGEERADKRAITRREETGAWDLDWGWQGGFMDEVNGSAARSKKVKEKSAKTANEEDITLPSTGQESMGYADDDPYSMNMFDNLDGIGSQDFDYDGGLDLDLGLGEEYEAAIQVDEGEGSEMDVEFRRDAASASRKSYGDNSLLDGILSGDNEPLNLGLDKTMSDGEREEFELDPLGLGDDSLGGGGLNLGLDMDGDVQMDIDARAATEDSHAGDKTPRAGSPAPGTINATASMIDVTPRTAARINAALEAKKTPEGKEKKAKKLKRVLVDKQTQGVEREGEGAGLILRGGDKDDKIKKGMLIEPQFLPKSKAHLFLLEVDADPVSYYFPHHSTDPKSEFIYANATDTLLAPELEEVFKLPKKRHRRVLADVENEKDRGLKRGRESSTEDDDVEHPRKRDASTPGRLDIMGDPSFDSVAGVGFDTSGGAFQLDQMPIEAETLGVEEKRRRRATTASDVDEMGLLAHEMDLSMGQGFKLDEGVSILSIFDEQAANETQGNVTQQKSLVEDEETFREDIVQSKSGWSRNTVKALKVLNNELTGGGDEEPVEVVNFQNIAEKASRRAAASFFFELLVLNSRDCVKLHQSSPFEDIQVKPKPKLWEMVGKSVEGGDDSLEAQDETTIEHSQEL